MEVADMDFAQVGGIVGEFNATYGTMGSAFGVTTTSVESCDYAGTPVFTNVAQPVFGETAGAGEPAPLTSFWGPSMSYKIENCTYRTSPLEGEWYGLYCGSPVTLTVADGRFNLVSEAFSSMNMSCGYTLKGGKPAGISLSAGPSGMAGEGIYVLKGNTMDLLVVFGAPGMVQAPQSFEEAATNFAATYFTLSRDKSVVEQATAPVDVPAAAALAFFILLAGFCFEPLNALWHGGALPNGFLYRFAFLFLFIEIICAALADLASREPGPVNDDGDFHE